MEQKFFKKGIAFLVSAIMLSGTATTVFADSASSDVSTNSQITEAELIDIGNQYVFVNDEGNIALNLPQTSVQEIGKENYQEIQDGISSINDLIESGMLETTENGTIYESNDDELVVQGGNVDKVTYHWWGVRRYANNTNTNALVNKFNTTSNGAWIVCGGSASGAAIFPASAPITGLISGLTGMAAGYWGLLATRISANNHGKGVIIDLTWVLVFNIKPQ